jgi:predicted patatin/cPLA2 family phospholipase
VSTTFIHCLQANLRNPRPSSAVVTVDHAKASERVPILLRDYGTAHHEPTMAPIWQCARATSAAPMYLPAIEIDGIKCIDGGVAANNPGGVALREAKNLGFETNQEIGVLLSIGTGSGTPKPWSSVKFLRWTHMLTGYRQVEEELEKEFLNNKGIYFRFKVPNLASKVGLNKWKKLKKIKKETEKYLDQPEVKEMVDQLATKVISIHFPKPSV